MKLAICNILWPTDFSFLSLAAADAVRNLARRLTCPWSAALPWAYHRRSFWEWPMRRSSDFAMRYFMATNV